MVSRGGVELEEVWGREQSTDLSFPVCLGDRTMFQSRGWACG